LFGTGLGYPSLSVSEGQEKNMGKKIIIIECSARDVVGL